MGLRNPVSWLQNGLHPAENDRLTWEQIFSISGIVASNDYVTTQSVTPAMSCLVGGGGAAILGTYQANMGVYLAFNDAPVTATISAAHPTLPRIDLLCLTVQDAAYTGSLNQVILQVIAGTPNASPVVPSTPVNSLAIANIAVAANATSILNANITDVRVRTQTNEFVAGTSNVAGVPLTIQQVASQTANSMVIKNSAGTILGYIDVNGVPQGSLAQGETFHPFLLMGA